MTRFLKGLSLALAAGLLLNLSVRADDKGNAPTDDKDFVMKATTAGQAEVKFSELAEKNASNERVKAFARRMVKDHTQANDGLTVAAKNQRVAVVAGLEKDTRDNYQRLSKLQGDEFDREYMKIMRGDHEKAVGLFAAEAKQSADPDLKKFAAATLPTIREHLIEARTICELLKIAKEPGK